MSSPYISMYVRRRRLPAHARMFPAETASISADRNTTTGGGLRRRAYLKAAPPPGRINALAAEVALPLCGRHLGLSSTVPAAGFTRGVCDGESRGLGRVVPASHSTAPATLLVCSEKLELVGTACPNRGHERKRNGRNQRWDAGRPAGPGVSASCLDNAARLGWSRAAAARRRPSAFA